MKRSLAVLIATFGVAMLTASAGTGAVKRVDRVRVIVTLEQQAEIHPSTARPRAVEKRMRRLAVSSQAPIRRFLASERAAGRVSSLRFFWVFNGFAVTATREVVAKLGARADVASVRPDATLAAPSLAEAGPTTPNVELIGAPALWAVGAWGQGTVVASLDTGVDATHPDLAAQWRGGPNSWFDPNGEHPDAPFDANGHGTATMGVMVGRDLGGEAIGVAPDAQWIAAKIFDDGNRASVSAIHWAFQWVIDPDGDPATADAPDVVNASWTFSVPGCDLEFEPDIQALRAVGIVPVFAAGNAGPGDATSMSPANNPGALAVGAVDNVDAIFPASTRGPTDCGGSLRPFPDVVAPGVDIRTADLQGTYASFSGTSLSAPHMTGSIALLLSALPELSASGAELALQEAAHDLGTPGVDDVFGHGRIDLAAAYETLTPSPPLLFSTKRSFSAGGTSFADEDVESFDRGVVEPFFDASDVGVATDLDALAVRDAQTLLLSFDSPTTLWPIGTVDDSDLVWFHAESLGETTAGRFELALDGSDVGLTSPGEDVDDIEILSRGRFLISTRRRARLHGLSGVGSDLFVFKPSHLGRRTAGSWSILVRGVDLGLAGRTERIDSIAVTEGSLFLSSAGVFSVGETGGTSGDVLEFSDFRRAPALSIFLSGGLLGVGDANVDAIEFPP